MIHRKPVEDTSRSRMTFENEQENGTERGDGRVNLWSIARAEHHFHLLRHRELHRRNLGSFMRTIAEQCGVCVLKSRRPFLGIC